MMYVYCKHTNVGRTSWWESILGFVPNQLATALEGPIVPIAVGSFSFSEPVALEQYLVCRGERSKLMLEGSRTR